MTYHYHRELRDGLAPTETICDPREIPDKKCNNEFNLMKMPRRPEFAKAHPYSNVRDFVPINKGGDASILVRDPFYQGPNGWRHLGIFRFLAARPKKDEDVVEYHSERVERHQKIRDNLVAQQVAGSDRAPTEEQLANFSSYNPQAQNGHLEGIRANSMQASDGQHVSQAPATPQADRAGHFHPDSEPPSPQYEVHERRRSILSFPARDIVPQNQEQSHTISRREEIRERLLAIEKERDELERGRVDEYSYRAAPVNVEQGQLAPRTPMFQSNTYPGDRIGEFDGQELPTYDGIGVRNHRAQQDDSHGDEYANLAAQYSRDLDRRYAALRQSPADDLHNAELGALTATHQSQRVEYASQSRGQEGPRPQTPKYRTQDQSGIYNRQNSPDLEGHAEEHNQDPNYRQEDYYERQDQGKTVCPKAMSTRKNRS